MKDFPCHNISSTPPVFPAFNKKDVIKLLIAKLAVCETRDGIFGTQ